MRDYSQFRSSFWTGETGKRLREDPDAQRLAAYLFTSPHANVIGFYWLPILYAAREVGLSEKGVEEALQRLSAMGFAHYDATHEYVWVVNMAREQLTLAEGEKLTEKDNRGKGCRKAAELVKRSAHYPNFFAMYGEALGLPRPPTPSKAPSSPPSKPLLTASEEQKGTREGIGTREGERAGARGPSPEERDLDDGEPEPSEADSLPLHALVRKRFTQAYAARRPNPPAWPQQNVKHCHALASWLEPLGRTGAEYELLLKRLLANFFADTRMADKGYPIAFLVPDAEKFLNPPKSGRDVRRGPVEPAPASSFGAPTDLDTVFGPEQPSQPAAGGARR